MKWLGGVMLVLLSLTGNAQKTVFQNLTWEQAAELAQKENKIILVDAMREPATPEARKQKDKEEAVWQKVAANLEFCKQHVVAIRIDMASEAGKEFAPKLVMNMYPTYGFFMPNGDILGTVSPFLLAKNPELFLERGKKAWEQAEVKRNNKRSIVFEEIGLKEALEKAKKENIEVNICLKTLYNYIHKQLFINFSEEDMIYKKDRRKQEKIPKRIRKIGGRSIEERPEEINNRQEVGHFEADTVVGKRGTKEAILVLTDRKTRLEMVRKIPDKTAESVIKELSKIIIEYPGVIKSITSDNGSEFMRADKIEEENIAYYYAHSYSSWERGSNENNNKLIRRFIPKGTDISEVSEEEIKEIEKWMNDYPRKLFNGKSANEMYLSEFTKYFS